MRINDGNIKSGINEDVPATSSGSGQIEGMGVGPKGEPGVKKTTYKMKNKPLERIKVTAEDVIEQLIEISSKTLKNYMSKSITRDVNTLTSGIKKSVETGEPSDHKKFMKQSMMTSLAQEKLYKQQGIPSYAKVAAKDKEED